MVVCMPPKIPQYRLYIDESGTPSFEDVNGVDRQFLCLTGVIVKIEDVKDILHPKMEELKMKFFSNHHPDEPVILHRDDIVKKAKQFWPLRDPVLNDEWESDLNAFIVSIPFTAISVVADKRSLKTKYGASAHHPYLYILNMILERYVRFLEDNQSSGDVVAESRGSREDQLMRTEYERLYSSGTYYVSSGRFQQRLTSQKIKVKTKENNIAGLQLADLLCHPLKYRLLHHYKKNDRDLGSFATKLCSSLIKEGKLFSSVNRIGIRKVIGFGLKFID